MLQEAIENLITDKGGIYVDVTFGGGGYTKKILSELNENGAVYSFDQDADAVPNAEAILDGRFHFIQSNFRHIKQFLAFQGVKQINGLVADLGVSSHQFNERERGFSFRLGGDLDMRMDADGDTTAASILNEYNEADLVHIFSRYGEIKNAKTLASLVVRIRQESPIEDIDVFVAELKSIAPRNKENKYLSQVFQALRIEVNEEMAALEELLQQLPDLVVEGGKIVFVSYHSLEDRQVKNFINNGSVRGRLEQDVYGNNLRAFDPLNRKAMLPTEEEVEENSRARSAKLRAAVRNKFND